MKILINVMTENEQIRGPVRYMYELIQNFELKDDQTIYLVAGIWQKNIFDKFESEKIKVLYFDIKKDRISRALFFLLRVPFILAKYKIDVYFLPDTNPYLFNFSRTKVVSTIHDSAEYVIPYRFSKFQSIYRKSISKIQAVCSNHIITVSNSSKKDLIKYLSIAPSKITVIHNGVTKMFGNELNNTNIVVEGIDLTANKYILYVGVLEKGKNVDRLVEAYSQIKDKISERIKLYIVGRKANNIVEIQNIINENSLEKDVILFDYITDHELSSLYQNATIFAYLSEYEGFGLPILEAMNFRLPILTANNSSLIEVAGNAALLSDSDVESITNNLCKIIEDKILQSNLIANIDEHLKQFDWKISAKNTLEVIEKLMENK